MQRSDGRGATRDQTVALLGRVPIFTGCSKKQLRSIASIAEIRKLPAGRTLMREGEPGREFVALVDGHVEVRRKNRKLRTLGPGDWLGEIALLTGGPRTATATTTEPTVAIVIRGGMFRSLVERTPALAYKVLARVAALVAEKTS